MINGQQMTICWQVDDLFMGHRDPAVDTDLLQWLLNCYSTTDKKLNVTCGHRHDYLGMNIDFSLKGTAKINMIPYIGKILAAILEKITGLSSSPAAYQFFQIRPPIKTQSAGGSSPCVPPHHGLTSLSLKGLSRHSNDGCLSEVKSETA
jgi:hypothetical protein